VSNNPIGIRLDMSSGFVRICPVANSNGKPSEFYIGTTSALDHRELIREMDQTTYGVTMRADFPLVRYILGKVVSRQSNLENVEKIDLYKLACCSVSETKNGTVFALIRPSFAVDKSIVPSQTQNGHMVRALLRVCTDRNGSRYIHHLTFPNAMGVVSITPGPSSDATHPIIAWERLLKGFGISVTNTSESESINSCNWERFCVRNAHTGMSIAIKPRIEPSKDMGVGLDISFTRGDKKHCIDVSVCAIDNIFTCLTQTHSSLLRKVDPSLTEHRLSLDNGAYDLMFSIKHTSRVQCLLLHTAAAGNHFIASSDVNFSNNMVYTNVCAAGVGNVMGVERLALRMARLLQANLTPNNMGKGFCSLNDTDKQLLGLISSTDIATDLGHVFQSDDRSMKKLRLGLENLSMRKDYANGIQLLQNQQFKRSPIFVETRATSSSRAERPRWQDKHTTAANSDNLMRQKMMSARGVATLSLYTGSQHRADPMNTCVVFSDVKVPKMIYKEPSPAGRSSISAKRLGWGAPLSADAMSGCASVQRPIQDQFMYSFNRSSKELRVFNQRNDTEKTEHTIAMFVDADATVKGNVRTFVQKCVPKGSLVGALINCCKTHPSLYTRALSHLVLLDSMYRLDLISAKKSWGYYTRNWMNMYRTSFLSTLAKRGVITGDQTDQEYIDYCMFNQCMKQHISGMRMPCESFSLLVQQGIPLPYV